MNLIETLKSLWSRWIHKKKGPSSSNVLGFSSIPPNPADIFYSRAFLNQPNIEEEFSTNCQRQWRIRIWKDYIFASGDDSSIKRIDRATHICKDEKETISGNSPDDFAVTDLGEVIYVDWQERTVCRLLDNGTTEEILKLRGWKPWAICSSLSGDILVAMRSDDTKQARVVGFQGAKKTREYKLDQKGHPLYGSPAFVAENRNQDVCVSDVHHNRVTVVDVTGNFKFHYHGKQAAASYPTFYPKGIATNSQANILIADQENNCVHILDPIGQLVSFISTGCSVMEPYCLCVGSEDELYVGEYRQGKVKKIRYLQ